MIQGKLFNVKDYTEIFAFEKGKQRLIPNSLAITDNKIQETIINLIGEHKKAELIYRGSRDGF